MLPSLRLIIYVALGAPLWITAAFVPGFVPLALAYNAVLLLIAAADVARCPRVATIELSRDVEGRMNLGVPNPVVLRARNRSDFPLHLTLRDEPHDSWRLSGDLLPGEADAPPVARLSLLLEPGREGEALYQATPTRRGDFAFGALSGRYLSPWGLWHRQFRREAGQSVRVYPDTSEVRRYELRLRQGRLRDMGLHLLKLRGRGTEFESLRDYETGDEWKNINWKASARRGKLISTNYEVERDQMVLIALDCGRMMTALTRDEERGARSEEHNPNSPLSLSKLDGAINAAVLLSHVAVSMGDSVGLLLFDDEVRAFVPPRKGRGQTGAIIEALYAAQPRLVEPDYVGAYEYLLSRRLRRGLVITFTDLIDPLASRELIAASAKLRRQHNALCVTLANRDVSDLAELMPEQPLDAYQKAMAQKMLVAREGALAALRGRGVGILDVASEGLTLGVVNRYLDLKSRAAF